MDLLMITVHQKYLCSFQNKRQIWKDKFFTHCIVYKALSSTIVRCTTDASNVVFVSPVFLSLIRKAQFTAVFLKSMEKLITKTNSLVAKYA